MRPLILAFVLLAPFIALAQNYHLHSVFSDFSQAPAQFTHGVFSCAGMKMSAMVHKVQALLG